MTREKKLTNVRSVQSDEKLHVPPPRVMSLEDAIGYVRGNVWGGWMPSGAGLLPAHCFWPRCRRLESG
jgi:hypothetical protein